MNEINWECPYCRENNYVQVYNEENSDSKKFIDFCNKCKFEVTIDIRLKKMNYRFNDDEEEREVTL